ncbi:hypothetical protein ENLAB_32400 [Enterococcus innesii]|uniref:WxL domain-containing protein n=1 Tax=Enterococcus innesii TaxID=2839759 RepID=A0ABM7XWW6_9ENTE|nr:hypothetical protein [Enterococcus innesii]BDG69676.1 hypothetical protein ENLAB_32400 [Enterococcus innesii]
MKKITLATTLLIALTSLGLATTANAAEATDTTKGATLNVKEGASTIEMADLNDPDIDFKEIAKNGEELNTNLTTSIGYSAEFINREFGEKEIKLSVSTGEKAKGLTAEFAENAKTSDKVAQANNSILSGDIAVTLDATEFDSVSYLGEENPYVITLTAKETTTNVDPE